MDELVQAALSLAVAAVRARGAALFVSSPGGSIERLASHGETENESAPRLSLPLRAGALVLGRLEVWPSELKAPFVEGKDGRRESALPVPPADWALLESIAAMVAVALERSRLAAEADRAREDERARLARELHDGAAQGVGAAKLEIERLALRHPEVPLAPVLERLHGIFADLRALSRALRPPPLEALGLRGALRRLALDIERRAEVRATYAEHGEAVPLPSEVEWHLYRIAEEAVANIAHHARAARAAIELSYFANGVRLFIEDDGRGFVAPPGGPKSGHGPGGMGLFTIHERSRALGARLTLTSRPGGGTRVEVMVTPLPASQAAPTGATTLSGEPSA